MKLVHVAAVLAALGTIVPVAAAAPEVDTVDAAISRVTVYPDRAKVQRSAEIELEPGEHSLLFVNLPLTADQSSFRSSASGLAGVTLQGLSYRTDVQREPVHEEAADLERQIKRFERDSLGWLNGRKTVLLRQRELLTAMSSQRAQDEAHRAGLGEIDIARWEKAYGFLGEKMTAVVDSIRLVDYAITDVNQSIELLQSRLRKRQSQTETRTLTVQVNLKLEKAGKATVTLDYMIAGAQWRPLYDARLNAGGDTVELAMYAEIAQRTGEDWKDVKLELSTVRPSNQTGPGELKPWQLSIVGTAPGIYTGTTGRIAGTIRDQETGEPVVGASVLVVGTQRGAMTDFNGRYEITGLQPGTYAVRVSNIEYNTIQMVDVPVMGGSTRQQEFAMGRKISELDKTITVVGKQDPAQIYEVANQSNIAKQPVTTVDELLKNVAGVVTPSSGDVFIRGGRAGEMSFVADGVPINDPLGGLGQGGSQMQLVQGSVEYATVLSGEVATTFTVARKESVPSDGTAIRAYIARWNRPAEIHLIARPRLRTGVFREASLTNQDETPLMAGEISVFDGASYLGKTAFGRVYVPGDSIVLPFGASDELTVERKIVKRNHENDGDKVKQRETVEIVLTNKGQKARTVALAEPFPRSTDNQIKVRMRDVLPEPDLLEDDGTATWNVELAPGESKTVTFTYNFEFPRGVQISGF